jgi:AraC-like DNA-binding protein
LARLARQLVVPAKQLSSAINREKGVNASKYIDAPSVNAACQLLKEGAAVTSTKLECGFNTKSNFNREFLPITGVNPSTWIQQFNHKPAPHR